MNAILVDGSNSTLTANAVTIDSSGSLTISNGGVFTAGAGTVIAGNIQGTGGGSFIMDGAGTATLSGTNTFTGTTVVTSGTIAISGGSAIADTAEVSIASGAVFQVDSSESVGKISGAGDIVLGGNTLTTNSSSAATLSGVLSGTGGGLTKAGSGTLTLSGQNTYTGATTVNGGTLVVSGNLSSSDLTISNGATISAGTAAAVDKFSVGSLTLSGGGKYDFTIGNVNTSVAGSDYDQIASSGALTLNNTAASPFTIYVNGNPTGWSNTATYNWDIISAASLSGTFSAGNFSVNTASFSGDTTGGTWSVSNPSVGIIQLTFAGAAPDVTWSGGTGNWSSGFSSTPTDFTNLTYTGAGGTSTNNISSGSLGDVTNITFDSGAGAYTLAAGSGAAGDTTALAVRGDITNNSSSTQTISMNLSFGSTRTVDAASGAITLSGVISGSGGLTKNGSGTLTLSSAANNSYTGATTVNAGTLVLEPTAAFSGTTWTVASDLTVNSGATLKIDTSNQNAGSGNKQALGTITINAGGTLEWVNTASGNNPSLWSSGQLVGDGAFVKSGSGAQCIEWGAGSSGSLNNFNGTITINAGTLTFDRNEANGSGKSDVAIASGAAINLRRNSLVIDSLDGDGTITCNLGNAQSQTVDLGNNNGSGTFGGVIEDGSAPGMALIKNGSGTQTLTGSNIYTGATTINGGTLQIGAGGTSGSLSGSSAITNNATLVFNRSDAITVSNAIGGTGALIKDASNTLTLSGANTYTGATTISAGTLEIGAAGQLGSGTYAGNIANSGTLIYSGTNAQTLSGVISGSGALTQNSSGTLTLSGVNTYTGATTISAGTLEIGAGGTTGSLSDSTTITISDGGTLKINRSNAITISSLIGGSASGGLLKEGSGTLTLTNTTYNGATTVNAGTIALGGSATVGDYTSALTVAAGAAYQYSSDQTGGTTNRFRGGITGDGAFIVDTASGAVLSRQQEVSIATVKINAGKFEGQANASSLGTAATTIYLGDTSGSADAELAYSGGAATFTTKAGIVVQAGSSGTKMITSTPGEFADSTDITLNDSVTFKPENNTTGLVLGGVISGVGGVTLDAPASDDILTFAGVNTYTGATTISAGILEIAASGRLGSGTYAGNIANSGTLIYSGTNAQTLSGVISGSGALTQNSSGTLTLSGVNTYTGATTISAGTLEIGAGGRLGVGSYAGNIANSGTLIYSGTNAQTLSGVISGTGALTQNGSGTLTLSGVNTYTGATTINVGTISIGATTGLGSTSGVNLAGGTGLNYTGSAATLSRAISVTSGTATVSNSGSGLLTLSGALSKNGTTLVLDGGAQGINVTGVISGSAANSDLVVDGDVTLSAANTYNGPTTINSGGNLTAAVANAMGTTTNVVVNTGGSLLVHASNAINDSASVNLSGGTWGFNGNISETVGALTLSANSTLDMSGGNIFLTFASLASALTESTRLKVINYTLYADQVYFTSNANVSSSLQYISFYSDGGSSFIGSSFIEGLSSPWQVRPVPEPETWATAALLLIGGGIWMWRKRRVGDRKCL